jgi:multidrug efflux pump subunit AcrA (membrane-fusion protein)
MNWLHTARDWFDKARAFAHRALKRFWAFVTHTDGDDPFRMSAPARIGALGIMGFLVVFLAWASFVTLDSAVIASGIVSVEGKRKKVEHFEGGIVERVLVNDGDVVTAGQALIILSKTQSLSALDILLSEQDAVLALEARLDAELADADDLKLPPELTERVAIPAAQAAISGQTKLSPSAANFRGEIEI